jgi:hypothetical protein
VLKEQSDYSLAFSKINFALFYLLIYFGSTGVELRALLGRRFTT